MVEQDKKEGYSQEDEDSSVDCNRRGPTEAMPFFFLSPPLLAFSQSRTFTSMTLADLLFYVLHIEL